LAKLKKYTAGIVGKTCVKEKDTKGIFALAV
jgi:hypothetical protein